MQRGRIWRINRIFQKEREGAERAGKMEEMKWGGGVEKEPRNMPSSEPKRLPEMTSLQKPRPCFQGSLSRARGAGGWSLMLRQSPKAKSRA